MDFTDDDSLDFTGWPRPTLGDDEEGCIRFADGITLADLDIVATDNGCCLMIYCRHTLITVLSSMGGSAECFRFADGGRLTAEELLARL